jgi:pimeloyl-ACP methyl ester carboxylesterase
MPASFVAALKQRLKTTPAPRPGWIAAGLALAAAAVYVQTRARRAEAEHPPAGRFVYVDGVRLHYVDRGKGEVVVLMHGNQSMVEDIQLSGLLDTLASRYRVIVFDRPGYGHSERPRTTLWTPQAQADLLHRALQEIGVARAVVLAHSIGTQTAIALALKYPYFVRSMVLMSGYYYPTPRLDVPWMSVPAIPLLGDLMRYTLSPLLSRLIWPLLTRRVFNPSAVPERFTEYPVWLACRPSQLRASSAETAMMIPEAAVLSRHHAELTMPIVIVAGDGDRMVDTRTQSVRLQQELPHSILQIVPGEGHMLHYVATDEVLSALEAALGQAEFEDAEEAAVRGNLAPRSFDGEPRPLLH